VTLSGEAIDWEKSDGLVPAIVQHGTTGRVLMLGYMNAEALAATQTSGLVTFYSRSRKCLWTKGETSGNKLELSAIELDCDRDTLLVTAIPAGPTCHLERNSCFDQDTELPGFGFIGQLESVIEDRMANPEKESYTTQLMNAGIHRMAQKIGEEGVELALAATKGDHAEITSEAADLIYHVLVLLKQQGLEFADVAQQLQSRHQS
jgi:phosphoribosyl-ATP pyrophosphohydrolase/phosphoribosyl-AMP cyclohydrolase